jgi:hypothetical protein
MSEIVSIANIYTTIDVIFEKADTTFEELKK